MNVRRFILLGALIVALAGCEGAGDIDLDPMVQGQVVDATSNEPLSGVTITLAASQASSNATGGYLIFAPKGTHVLRATRSGYAPFEVTLAVGGSVRKDIAMVRLE